MFWNGPDEGSFHTNTNWLDENDQVPSSAPGSGDEARFDVDDEFTVNFSSDVENLRVRIEAGDYTLDLGGVTYTLTNTDTGSNSIGGFSVAHIGGQQGTVEILDGTVRSILFKVGHNGIGTAIVGEGAVVTADDAARVGSAGSGTGTLIIEDGGVFEVLAQRTVDPDGSYNNRGRMFIGQGNGTGTVTVRGAGSSLSVATSIGSQTNIRVGADGNQGTLNIENGGTVVGTGGVGGIIGQGSSSGFAYVSGAGSTWTTNGLSISNDGLLDITNGGQVIMSSGSLTVETGGILSGNGTVTGNVVNEGTLRPGNSTGTLTIDGDYSQHLVGLLDIEIGGTGSGLFDAVHITGDSSLDGGLDVALVNDFELNFGQFFQIMRVEGDSTGVFNGLGEGDVVGSFGGMDLFITYDPQDTFSTTFGGVGLYTIPEPSALLLLLMAGFLGIGRRRLGR